VPGNLQAASPVGVLPQTLCLAFTESRLFPMLAAKYHDGTTERSLIIDGVNAATSLKTWSLSKRLKATDLATLKSFFAAHQGVPFYFYSPSEATPGTPVGSNYDPTGVATVGRYTVRFSSQAWSETSDIARTNVALEIAECA
jgi:phage-related protein